MGYRVFKCRRFQILQFHLSSSQNCSRVPSGVAIPSRHWHWYSLFFSLLCGSVSTFFACLPQYILVKWPVCLIRALALHQDYTRALFVSVPWRSVLYVSYGIENAIWCFSGSGFLLTTPYRCPFWSLLCGIRFRFRGDRG